MRTAATDLLDRLGEGPRLPHELARRLCADIGADERFAVHLIVQMDSDHGIRVARQPCGILDQRRLAAPSRPLHQQRPMLAQRYRHARKISASCGCVHKVIIEKAGVVSRCHIGEEGTKVITHLFEILALSDCKFMERDVLTVSWGNRMYSA